MPHLPSTPLSRSTLTQTALVALRDQMVVSVRIFDDPDRATEFVDPVVQAGVGGVVLAPVATRRGALHRWAVVVWPDDAFIQAVITWPTETDARTALADYPTGSWVLPIATHHLGS